MHRENVVFTDFKIPTGWSFIKILESESNEKWNAYGIATNRYHGNIFLNLVRFILYFIHPFIIVLNRKKYYKIIGWQQFYSLNFAFWSRLLNLKKVNDLTVMTFIYKKKYGIIGWVYHKYMQYIVTSKYIDRFICFAKEECYYYSSLFGVNIEKFVYIPLGVGDMRMSLDTTDEGYIFAAGRSNRNYDFIVDVWANVNYKLIIACDDYNKRKLPQNVTVLSNCYGTDMLSMMAKCHCVIVPLKDLTMSSGQLVVLQAMSMGKPVVCTKSEGICDYIINNKTGFLVNNNSKDWLDALNCLNDKDVWSQMSSYSLDLYKKQFTEMAMFKRIARLYGKN